MSLDLTLYEVRRVEVFAANITHNMTKMAKAAGIYQHLWRPEELSIKYARELIAPLTAGLQKLEERPFYYKAFNPPNGWGDYTGLVQFVRQVLAACKSNPNAEIEVSC